MPELKLNGKTYSGSTSYASAISYTEEDGSKTTVQDKVSELISVIVDLQQRINNISFVVDENGDWCFLPDGSTTPIKLTEYREKKEYTATGSTTFYSDGTAATNNISFGCEFVSTPIVTCSFTTNEDSKYTSCNASNITTTGCAISVTKIDTSNERTGVVAWTAKGYVYV